MATLDDFSRALLLALRAPATSTNLAFLSGWYAREGSRAAFNPLATTLPAPGATNFNSVGVKNYPSFEAGVAATAQTLLGGYPRIVADLRAGDGFAAGNEAGELSKWSGGGYTHVGPGSGGGGLPGDQGGGSGGVVASITDRIGEWLLDAIGFLGLGLGGAQAAASSKLAQLRQDSFKESARVVLTPATVAEAVVKGHMTLEDAENEALSSGINQDRLRMLVETTGNPPGFFELLRLWRRGIIDRDGVAKGLQEGYTRPDWIAPLLQLQYDELTPEQAIEAAVQGQMAHDDAQAAALRAGMSGVNFDIMYQTAGNPPGPTELATLFQRGDIDQARFQQGLRESRLKNAWIPDFMKLAVRKIPLRTITTLLNNGAISDDLARSKLQQLGYSQEDADALIAGHKAPAKQKHHELTVTQVTELYREHLISRDQAVADLVAIGYDGGAADQLLTYSDVVIAHRFQVAAVSKVRSSYVARKITRAQASGELDRLQTPADQRDAMLALWDIEQESSPHTLSPADVAAAGHKGFLSPDQVLQRLTEMGFSDVDAVLFAQVHNAIPTTPPGG